MRRLLLRTLLLGAAEGSLLHSLFLSSTQQRSEHSRGLAACAMSEARGGTARNGQGAGDRRGRAKDLERAALLMPSHIPRMFAGVADVPQELNRKFAQIRELDERAYQLEKQVDADTLAQLKLASRERRPLLQWLAVQDDGILCTGRTVGRTWLAGGWRCGCLPTGVARGAGRTRSFGGRVQG